MALCLSHHYTHTRTHSQLPSPQAPYSSERCGQAITKQADAGATVRSAVLPALQWGPQGWQATTARWE